MLIEAVSRLNPIMFRPSRRWWVLASKGNPRLAIGDHVGIAARCGAYLAEFPSLYVREMGSAVRTRINTPQRLLAWMEVAAEMERLEEIDAAHFEGFQ